MKPSQDVLAGMNIKLIRRQTCPCMTAAALNGR